MFDARVMICFYVIFIFLFHIIRRKGSRRLRQPLAFQGTRVRWRVQTECVNIAEAIRPKNRYKSHSKPYSSCNVVVVQYIYMYINDVFCEIKLWTDFEMQMRCRAITVFGLVAVKIKLSPGPILSRRSPFTATFRDKTLLTETWFVATRTVSRVRPGDFSSLIFINDKQLIRRKPWLLFRWTIRKVLVSQTQRLASVRGHGTVTRQRCFPCPSSVK